MVSCIWHKISARNRKNKNTTLRPLHGGPRPIKKVKLNDLIPDAQKFYAAFKSDEADSNGDIVEYADNIPIDENEDP